MFDKLLIRLAKHSDAEGILQTTREAFIGYSRLIGSDRIDALSETKKDIENDIKNKTVIVATDNDEIIGCVRLEIQSLEAAYISRFSVGSKYRRMGVGKLLLDEIEKKANDKCVKRLFLHTAADADELVAMYENRGFSVESTDNERGYNRALFVKYL